VGHKVRQSRPSLSSPPASRQTVSDLQSWLLFNTHAKQQLAAQIPEQELKDLLGNSKPDLSQQACHSKLLWCLGLSPRVLPWLS